MSRAERLANAIEKSRGERDAFGPTNTGQTAYDVLCSSLSAAEVARRHQGISRAFVLHLREVHPELRKRRKKR